MAKSRFRRAYLKKYGAVSRFAVWIVDGQYIRRNIDEEFTNFGQHYQFKFIPKNEFWIDRESVPGEERFFIDCMLVMNRLMAAGVSHKGAAKASDRIEKRERSKALLIKRKIKLPKRKKDAVTLACKRLLKKYSKKIKVWIVDGELVRDLFFLDFTEGGHDKVYPFVPAGEVWIDDDVSPKERKFVLLHELHERNLMCKGLSYDDAHRSASEIEYHCRHHPEELDRKIRDEIKKASKD